jgi:hypothetical protein
MLALAGTEQPYFRRDLATAPLKQDRPGLVDGIG